MTAATVRNNQAQRFFQYAQNYRNQNEPIEGVYEVCANISFYTDDKGDHMKIEFTSKDKTHIPPIVNTDAYIGRGMDAIAKIWNIAYPKCDNEGTPEEGEVERFQHDLETLPSESIKHVKFSKFVGTSSATGEPFAMQNFRKANAIEIAQYNTSRNTKEA